MLTWSQRFKILKGPVGYAPFLKLCIWFWTVWGKLALVTVNHGLKPRLCNLDFDPPYWSANPSVLAGCLCGLDDWRTPTRLIKKKWDVGRSASNVSDNPSISLYLRIRLIRMLSHSTDTLTCFCYNLLVLSTKARNNIPPFHRRVVSFMK